MIKRKRYGLVNDIQHQILPDWDGEGLRIVSFSPSLNVSVGFMVDKEHPYIYEYLHESIAIMEMEIERQHPDFLKTEARIFAEDLRNAGLPEDQIQTALDDLYGEEKET